MLLSKCVVPVEHGARVSRCPLPTFSYTVVPSMFAVDVISYARTPTSAKSRAALRGRQGAGHPCQEQATLDCSEQGKGHQPGMGESALTFRFGGHVRLPFSAAETFWLRSPEGSTAFHQPVSTFPLRENQARMRDRPAPNRMRSWGAETHFQHGARSPGPMPRVEPETPLDPQSPRSWLKGRIHGRIKLPEKPAT